MTSLSKIICAFLLMQNVVALIKNGKIKKGAISYRAKLYVFEEDEWSEGEVSWDVAPTTQYNTQQTSIKTKNEFNKYYYKCVPDKTIKNVYEKEILEYNTPLKNKIKQDQTSLASASEIAKMSFKEMFNVDLFISELNVNLNTHTIFTPSEMFLLTVLSGVAFVYNKAKESEMTRYEKLQNFVSKAEYFEKYKTIRRNAMIVFIVLTSLFTRHVQIAE